MDTKKHWEKIYLDKTHTEVTWFQIKPLISLELIDELNLGANELIIDVGAGSSTLAENLLERGFQALTVLDISQKALDNIRKRLGDKITYLVSDFKALATDKRFKLWHDRAVFHFLTHKSDRLIYQQRLKEHMASDGYLLISTFASDGPEKCSGLKIVQYSKEALIDEFKEDFVFIKSRNETHISPKGLEQKFIYCLFKRRQQ
ncbi:MAG: SAM-dependent methyltransferase [Epsilonproteobacteria bacterium]|nr:MAG: SAM-dependent methyltransferase [Campylobacterota bacterium]RLA65689.1 MAG: SAM-dependent methyltransferase [Campylobacterota bacterium]